MNCACYARVSTQEQSNALQLTDLRAYCERNGWIATEYTEKASSVKRRPVFERMLADAKAGRVDVILVWRIDRFARSIKDFVDTTLLLDTWKVRLISTTESVDTGDANPFAEFQRGLLALLAQLERKIIIARVNAGIAEAKRQGKHCGRPRRIFSRDKAAEMRAEGMSWRAIAKALEIPFSTLRGGVRKVSQPPVS